MPSSISVEAYPHAWADVNLLLRVRAVCCSVCRSMQAERLESPLNGCE